MRIIASSRKRLASFSHQFDDGIGGTDGQRPSKFFKCPTDSSLRSDSHPAARRVIMVAGRSSLRNRGRRSAIYEAVASRVDTYREADSTLLDPRTP